jgi:hypothetical protein
MPSYQFTYNQEIGHQGQSLVPHYPGGKSGVTIGPGYDMGHRSPQQIYNDLTNAGIDPETAYSLIEAANKTGSEAGNWIAQKGGIIITEDQQRALFENVLVPEYEERTKAQLAEFVRHNEAFSEPMADWDQLSNKQKSILFDYVYNTGSLSRFPELTSAVLQQDWEEVSHHYERFSNNQPLAYRNEMFYREFLDPDNQYPEDELPGNSEEQVAGEDIMTDDINELYFDNTNEVSEKGSDDWYENA